jgi:hypothetical protein
LTSDGRATLLAVAPDASIEQILPTTPIRLEIPIAHRKWRQARRIGEMAAAQTRWA